MFKAEVKMQAFKELLDVASTIVKETIVAFSNEGIIVRAADQGHIACMWLTYNRKIYEEFTGGPDEIAIEIEKVRKSLNFGKADGIVILEYNSDDGKLVIQMGDITRRIATLDKTNVTQGPATMNYGGNIKNDDGSDGTPVSAVIKTEDLKNCIRASASIGDQVTLGMSEEGITFDAVDENDSLHALIPIGKVVKKNIHSKARCIYPLNFLTDVITAITSDDQVNIHIWNAYPIKMEFGLASGFGKCVMMLAPRVEE